MKGIYILSICLFSLLVSCGKQPSNSVFMQERAVADSLTSLIGDTTEAKAQLKKYRLAQNKAGEMMALKQLGKLYRENDCYLEAINCHQKEFAIGSMMHDTIDMVQALNSIGTNFRRLGILDEASNYHYKALKYSSDYSDSSDSVAKKNKVMALNGIGNICLALNVTETADSAFRAALAGERELGSHLGQAINYANIGALFENKGMKDSAWTYYRMSMKHNVEAKSQLGIALCHNHYGHLYETDGNLLKAINEYSIAYDIMSRKADKWHWLESCLALARAYVAQGDFDNAKLYLAKAKDEATRQNCANHLADIYMQYYKLYAKGGDNAKALSSYIKSREYSDSVSSERHLVHLQNVRIKYVYDRRQTEIEALNKSYLNERSLKNLSVTGLTLFVFMAAAVIGLLGYTLRIAKRKQRMMLETEKMRESFFTNITHEFRTPLTVILGYSAQMEKGEMNNSDMAHTGKIITRQGRQLLAFINQLLDISRIKSAVSKPQWKHGDIALYISMLVENFHNQAELKGVRISYRHEGEKSSIDFVPDYVLKIVSNLVSNALKFSTQGGEVRVTSAVNRNQLTLRVADQGIGMSHEEQEHIFELFYQSDNKLMGLGSGVGLTLVKQIVDSMSGHITVESEPGNGTMFNVVIPCVCRDKTAILEETQHNVPEPEPVAPMQGATNDTDDAPDNSKPTILIVEDNDDVAQYMGDCLRRQYNVLTASDGEQGLEKASSTVPDIIVTDLMMPHKDGLQLCDDIRRSELLCHIPVVMVTAKSTNADKMKGLKTGADAYIRKPFSAEELLLTIGNIVERQRLMRQKYAKAIESQEQPENVVEPRDMAFIEKLNGVIFERMTNGDISVEIVATLMCMTGQQLRRKLFATTGETPAYYIKRTQMQEAKRMMDEQREIAINEVAIRCGYCDTSHFTRSFKSVYGVTPSQYRKGEKEGVKIEVNGSLGFARS